jgi:hypothetical protein
MPDAVARETTAKSGGTGLAWGGERRPSPVAKARSRSGPLALERRSAGGLRLRKHSDHTGRACYRTGVISALRLWLRAGVGGHVGSAGAPRRAGVLSASLLVSACGLQLENGAAGEGTSQDSEANRPVSSNVIPNTRPGGSGGAPNLPMFGSGLQRGIQLQGSVEYRFDDASFLHCGLQELWAIRFEGLAFESFQEVALGEECDIANCLFLLEGAGDLSARGRFGNVREYPRELTVTRVLRLERVTRVADLPSLNGVSCPR